MGTMSDTVANAWLDAVGNATAYSEAAVYAQPHTGDPGAAGTSNVSGETTRQQLSFGAASSRAMTSDAAATWTGVAATETISWISIWDAAAAGNFLGRDQLASSSSVNAGDNFTLPAGDVDFSIT